LNARKMSPAEKVALQHEKKWARGIIKLDSNLRGIGFDKGDNFHSERKRFGFFEGGGRARIQIQRQVHHADVWKLILEIGQEPAKVVEMGRARDGQGRLLIWKIWQQVHRRRGADGAELREFHLIRRLK